MSSHREFERMVDLYERRLYNVALRLTARQDEAAELTHEVFVRAFRFWDKFRKESQTYTWLYRILINLNKDRLARLQRRRDREAPLYTDDESPIEIPDYANCPDSAAQTQELRDVLGNAIQSLPPGYRECIVLKDLEGLSYEQIAQAMGISVEAVRSRLARARQQLRQTLTPYLKT